MKTTESTDNQGIRTVRRSPLSRDTYSPGYLNKLQWVRQEHWYDIHPWSLAVWPHWFSDNIRRGEWWIRRSNYGGAALELELEGETCYRCGQEELTLRPGELFVTVPGADLLMSNGPGRTGRQLQLVISGGMIKMLTESFDMRKCRLFRFTDPAELQALKERFFRIAELMARKDYNEAAENSHLGYEFIAFLSRRYAQEEKQGLPPLLTRAVWAMESDRGCRLSVNRLAAELGTSRATLTRLFGTYLNTTPHAYWNELRMESAKQLVAAGQLSFKEIAEKLGFRNSLYFSTAFRQYTGMTPSLYRRSESLRGEML